MKLIENSVEIESLQSLVSYGELEVEMSNCEIVHVNGQKTEKENLPEKEPLKKIKLTNGVNGIASPIKKTVHGCMNYEIPDDDYQLVLESSSDDGGSPSKKVDEDVISAPQIVQEIEDLLGIDSNSARIEEEIKISEPKSKVKEDDTKISNGIISSKIPQEIQDVFEEKEEMTNNESGNVSKEISKEGNKDETTDCNSSSIMNVVYDEVEIGTDNIEEHAEIDSCLQKTEGIDNPCKSLIPESNNEINIRKEGNSHENSMSQNVTSGKFVSLNQELTVTDGEKNDDSIKDISDCPEVSPENDVPNDLPLTQISNISESSIEWTVIDSIEESEDECSQKLSSDNDIKPYIDEDKISIEHSVEIIEKKDIQLVKQSEEESRKRTASINDEEILCKKPKLDGEELDSSIPNLKRSCSEAEHEAKRSKLGTKVTENFHLIVNQNNVIETQNMTIQSGENSLQHKYINDGSNTKSSVDEQLLNSALNKDNKCHLNEEKTLKQSNLAEENDSDRVASEIKSSVIDDALKSSENIDSTRVLSEMKASVIDIELKSSENEDSTKLISELKAPVTDVELKSSENQDPIRLSTEIKAPFIDAELISSENKHSTRETCDKNASAIDVKFESSEVESLMECVVSETSTSKVMSEIVTSNIKAEIKISKNNILSDLNICGTADSKTDNLSDSSISKEVIKHINNSGSTKTHICNTAPKTETVSTSDIDVEVKSPEQDSLADKDISNISLIQSVTESPCKKDGCFIESDINNLDHKVSNELANKNENFLKSTCLTNEKASTEESPEAINEKISDSIDIEEKNNDVIISRNNKQNQGRDLHEGLKMLVENNDTENVKVGSINSKINSSSNENINELNMCNVAPQQAKVKISNKDDEKLKTNSEVLYSTTNKEIPVENKEVNFDKEQNRKKSNSDSSLNCKIREIGKTNFRTKEGHSKKNPFDLLTKHFQNKKPEAKKNLSTVDKAVDRVFDNAKSDAGRALPLLKKFHKDQLTKLTRSGLEELIVMKFCEVVTDRCEIGQMRLRCQTLEQNCELWRKKAMQLEKQNRELEMVLKRYLTETAQIKKENQNKLILPIRVTRSVGLQVVLESNMHGALVSSKNKVNSETSGMDRQRQLSQQQQLAQQQLQQLQSSKAKRIEKESPRSSVKAPVFNPPVQASRGRGRPAKNALNSNPSPSVASMPQPSISKVTPPNTPVKPQTISRPIGTPNKSLEVIDLTDKDEKSKSLLQSSAGPSIRIAPSTQVCFMQNSPSPSTSQTQMAYIVQKPGQRQQYLVATSSPSPPRPVSSSNRPPPALAVPVFRSGGQIIPVQSTSQGVVRTTSSAPNTNRQVPSAIRLSSSTILKHPAPLPPPPASVFAPGLKAPPPKPQLKIAKTVNGIMLSWSMTLTKELAEMASYQLYAYQEGSQQPSSNLWKKVGDVKALPLPMACTLTQFMEGNKYHFAVRAVDIHGRVGPFSSPGSILLTK